MVIKILGTGCPNCKRLEENVREALKQLNKEGEIIKITKISEIMSYGIMSLPALIIDERVAIYGTISSVGEIKKIFIADETSKPEIKSTGCSCGGKC